ncbi:MAG TPA: six-cysteine peptide SCIFF [Desulfotomaculum sp.]|jgi:predicted ribosomally synthesized six-cysteine peptide SCIFF|nr:six-cysteine peptide SCIFF [Desulfotomaculum sp.]
MGKHIKTVAKPYLQAMVDGRGCGECQTSCQSACKTSITVSNQVCLKKQEVKKPARS